MRFPQLLIYSPEGRLEAELRELAAKRRWLLRQFQQQRAIHAMFRQPRPTVLLLSLDPYQPAPETFTLLHANQDALTGWPSLVVLTQKVPEDLLAMWVAALLDLGASYVIMPPLQRPVLEELVSMMMAARWPEVTSDVASAANPLSEPLFELVSDESGKL